MSQPDIKSDPASAAVKTMTMPVCSRTLLSAAHVYLSQVVGIQMAASPKEEPAVMSADGAFPLMVRFCCL